MKKVLFVSALFILAVSAKSIAQKGAENDRKNVVKVNPLGLIFGAASISYERAISEKNSIVIAPTFGAFKLGGFKYSSFGLSGEYRFYLSKGKTAPEGLYAAPGLGFNTGKVKQDGVSTQAKFTSFGGKAVIGNQWIFGSGFTLDLNGGISYSSYSYKDNTGSGFNGLKASGILPALGFSLGYAF
jgi:Protein of unknown function (DUF3575)